MHMPFTPEANLFTGEFGKQYQCRVYVLDKLFGLYIVHPMDTSDTISVGGQFY
jgi:hypothetical protein